jgi:hypothetical protein
MAASLPASHATAARLGCPLATLATAILCLAAGTAAAAPAPIALRVAQAPDAAGRSVVSVSLATTAEGNNQQVTVFIQPGRGGCQPTPLRPWPRGSAQLLYGWTPYPARRWDRLVRFAAPGPGSWTVCGYVVSEPATRDGLGRYVQARTLARFSARTPPRGTPVPGPVPWTACAANPRQRLLRLQVPGTAPGGCRRARTIVDAWTREWYGEKSTGRENWSFGWFRPDGSTLRISHPRLRFSLLRVPALARTLACRETTVSSNWLSPLDLQCGIARFRFGDRVYLP